MKPVLQDHCILMEATYLAMTCFQLLHAPFFPENHHATQINSQAAVLKVAASLSHAKLGQAVHHLRHKLRSAADWHTLSICLSESYQ